MTRGSVNWADCCRLPAAADEEETVRIMAIIAALTFVAGPSTARAIEGLPGSIWGTAIYDITEDNPKTLGQIRQGVDWFKLYGLNVSTYAEFAYRFEREEAEFFDAYGPALGVALRRGSLRVGWEYEWEHFPKLEQTQGASQIFAEWWYGWDLKNFRR